MRPLLGIPKTEIIDYARKNNLTWHEDSTNADTKYLRNKIRHEVVPTMTAEQKSHWLATLERTHHNNEKLDAEIQHILRRGLHKDQLILNRAWFIKLPHDIAKEVVHTLLRRAGAKDIDRKTIERLVVQIKTLAHGKTLQVSGASVLLTKRSARFQQSRGRQEAIKHV
jgi:tRNA(Ile)-lysidine synthase TilS/MesJ